MDDHHYHRLGKYTFVILHWIVIIISHTDETMKSTLLQQLEEQLKNKRMIVSKEQLELGNTVGHGIYLM